MNHSHFINRPENQCDESKKFNIDIVNDEIKDIFPTLFYDFELDIDNETIVNECYDLQKKFPKGVEKSNVNGWQSDVYELFTIKNYITPSIQELAKFVIDISNDISKQNESNSNATTYNNNNKKNESLNQIFNNEHFINPVCFY